VTKSPRKNKSPVRKDSTKSNMKDVSGKEGKDGKESVKDMRETKDFKSTMMSGSKAGDPRVTNTESMNQTKFTGPKEVEQNPFKKLIDITDLLDNETNPAEVEKLCQNILLIHNSDLKQWYHTYSKKFEATKREESFSMTLR